MDRRQIITGIILSAAVIGLWALWVQWYEKNHPPVQSNNVAAATQPASSAEPTTRIAATNPTIGPSSARAISAAAFHAVPPATLSGPVMIGSAAKDDATYAMQVDLTPHGAGIVEVTLNQFYEPDKRQSRNEPLGPYRYETPLADHPDTAVLATHTLNIEGHAIDLWKVDWEKGTCTPSSASFFVVVEDASSHPVAKITKTYTLDARTGNDGKSDGYEVHVTQTIENLRDDTGISVNTSINGPNAPPGELEQGGDRVVIGGYNEGSSKIGTSQTASTDFKEGAPPKDITQESSRRFVWAGQSSAYFAAIVLPDPKINPQLTVHAEGKNFAPSDHDVAMTFETASATIGPKQSADLPLTVFFGPKWRKVVADDYYSAWPRMYDLMLNVQSRMCAWCTWPWLIHGLVGILIGFHYVFKDWGLSIICLVVMVRVLLHPITKMSQVKMMKMGKMAPEVEKLKKKYADQPDVLNREMMKLYKEQGGAMLGCLPMFLQTPIWIALWSALQGTFELRQAPFLYNLTWIKDLARPDALIRFAEPGIPIPIVNWHIHSINLLPILMAAVTYINQKYFMPVPIAATPEQEQQQKVQRGMSLLFPLMFYTLPSGLNLYYVTSMSLGILESKIIRDHIKEQEELEKAMGPVLVPTKPTRGSRRSDKPEPSKPAKPGLVQRFMEAMQKAQEQAEKMKKEQQKQQQQKKKPK